MGEFLGRATGAVRRSISDILDGLETAVNELTRLSSSDQPDETRRGAEVAVSWIRSLKEELPAELKKGPFRKLQRHMRFIELYRSPYGSGGWH